MNESRNEKVIYPDYTEFPIYKALADIAENAGITIEYVDKVSIDKDGFTIGGSAPDDQKNMVSMAKNHDYGTFEYATFVLAHEIAHTLIKELYSEKANDDYPDKIHIRNFFEADADKIGVALYNLAEMTAMYKSESRYRNFAE